MRHHVTTKASCLLLLAALVNADFFYPTHDELLYSSHRGAFGRRLNLRQSGRNGFECPGEGFFADPKDCSKFYRCVNYGNGNGYAAFEFKCSEGTVFDESIIACNHPWAVNGPCGATQVSSGEMGSEQPHGPATGGRPPPTPAPEPEPEPEPTDNEIEGASTGSGSDSRPNCKEEGYFTDENDCRKFYRCVAVDAEGHFDVYRFACGPGTVFDESKRVCAHPRDVEGRCGVTEAANEVDSEDMGNGSMESTTAGGSSSESSPSNSESSTSSSSHSESSTSLSHSNESPNSSEPTTSSTSSSSSESSTSSSSQSPSENNHSSSSGSGSSTESSGSKPSGESEDSQSQSGNDCNKPAYKGECEEEGFFPVAGDCTKFYRCVSNGKPGSFSKYDFECGEGTVFDPDNNVCNHASAVQRDCDNPESASQTMGSENNGTQNESSKPAEPEGSNEVNPEDSESPSSESSSENTTAAGSSESSTSSSENSSPAESSTESSSENSSPAESSSESNSESSSPAESSSESSSEATTEGNSGSPSESSSGSNENTSESSSTEAGSSEAPPESSSESGSSESSTANSEDSSSEGTGKDQCTSEGFHPTSGDCKKFYRCVENEKGGFDKYDFVCGDGTVFDPKHNVCNHERDVDRDCGAPASGEDHGGEEGSTPAGEEDNGNEGSGNGTEGGSSSESGPQSSTENGSSESSTEGSETGVSPAEGEENSAGAPEEQNSTEGSSQGQSSTESSSPGNSEGDSTTTQSSQTSSDSGECTSEGFFPHKSDCKKFYRCVDNGKGGLTKYDFDCAEGTVFDPEINVCNHERDVQRDCSASMTTTSAPEDQDTTTQAGTTQISDGEMETTTQLNIDNEPPGIESTTTSTEDPNPDEPTPPISPPCIHIDPNPPVVNCTMDGYYPDPTNCSNFYRCIGFDDENQKFNVYFFRCPNGKYYDPQRNVCDKPENIQPPRDCEAMEETTTSVGTTTQPSGGETTTTAEETTTAAHTTPPEDSTTTAATDTTAAQTESTTQAPSETTTQTQSETTTQPPDEQQQTTTAPPETEGTTPAAEQQTTTEVGETTTAAPEPEGTTTAAPESTKEPGGEQTTTPMPEDSTTPASEETTPFEPSDNTTTTEMPPESSCDCCNLEEGQYAYICPTGFRRHPKYCNRFYQCTQKEENDVNVLVLNCPEGLIFDTAMQKCEYPDEAAPCHGEIAPEAPPSSRSRNSKIAVRVGREDLCPNTGFYPYEDDCQHFIHCQSDAQGNIRGKMKRCPEGFTFWEVSRRCEVVARIAKRCSGRSKSVMAWNIPTDYSNIGRLSRQLLRMF